MKSIGRQRLKIPTQNQLSEDSIYARDMRIHQEAQRNASTITTF